MERYFNLKIITAALLASVFSTAFAIVELFVSSNINADGFSGYAASLLAAAYLAIFFINFWIVMFCYELTKKIFNIKILTAGLSFIIYFIITTLLLYASTFLFKAPDSADISLYNYFKIQILSAQYVISFQFFIIAYAFLKVFTKSTSKNTVL